MAAKKAARKTTATKASATRFLKEIADADIKRDAATVAKMLKELTGAKPLMWGTNIVGYGTREVKYADGRVEEWMLAGFAPRKDRITLYITGGLDRHKKLLARLGPHARGGGCLHIKRLDAIELPVLKTIVSNSVQLGRR